MTMPWSFRRIGLCGIMILSACLLASGCGKSKKQGTVSGKITYADKPVTGGRISFHPAEGSAYPGEINPDGTYAVPAVPAGDMKITIETEYLRNAQPSYQLPAGAPPGMAEKMKSQMPDVGKGNTPTYTRIPAKYANAKTTPLTMKVESGSQSKDFNLTD